MNHKHSFLARSLALLLALVLVLSNANIGLTMSLQAAENGNLFDLIAASDCGTKELNAVLAYADALYNLNDETVKYEAAPTTADAILRHGKLEVNAVNGWVPYTYTVGDKTVAFTGTTVELGKDVKAASVVYKLDLNKDEAVATALAKVAALAADAGAQADALDKISGTTALTALAMLDYGFTEDMIDAVDALTLADLGIEADFSGDLNEDGVVDWKDELIAAEAEKKVAEELAATKAQYKAIIRGLQDRMVVEGNPYYEVVNAKGKPVYEDSLLVYAMLKEYKKETGGLAHFYQNAAMIVPELKELSVALYNILGEANEDGTYANDAVVNALLVEMGYDDAVDAADLATMAGRMENAYITLGKLDSYKTEINTNSKDLVALCDALAACGTVSNYNTDLCLYSSALNVLDDSFRWLTIVVADTDVTVPYEIETGVVLTEAMVAEIIAAVENNAPYYDVDTTAIKALVGTKMDKNLEITCAAEAKEFKIPVKNMNGEALEYIVVSGTDKEMLLSVPVGHKTTYKVNGEEIKFDVDFYKVQTKTIALDMAKVAAGLFEILIVEDENQGSEKLLKLVADLNAAIGPNAFVLDDEYKTLTANITLGDLATFGKTVWESFYGNVYMADTKFIYNDGTVLVNLQAIINALVNDETFSNEKLIAMGQGRENNLLTSVIEFPGYRMDFVMNLTSIPARMATVSKGLSVLEEYFTFESNPDADRLDVTVTIPEKIFEAYLTAAIATWRIDADNVAELNNAMAINFLLDEIRYAANTDVTTTTLTNTLAAVGVDKDLTGAEEYFQMLKDLLGNEENFYCETYKDENGQDIIDMAISADKSYVEAVASLLGLTDGKMDAAMTLIADEEIKFSSKITVTNDVPDYEALVIEPIRVTDNGIKNKLNTIDYTADMVAKVASMKGSAIVKLLDDVNGSLNFPAHVIIDLNGKTINGDLTAAGKLVVIDSALDNYNGGKVTGNVSSNGGAILGGTYADDVTAYLRDGYVQDNGSVKNAMFYIECNNGVYTYVLNADFYQLCDGYLPSVEALAVEIATDIAINGYYIYTAVAMAYEGQTLYSLNIDEILDSYLGDGVRGAVDALITDAVNFFHADGINALANDIIDDLCNFKALSAALENNAQLSTYAFSTSPLIIDLVHNKTNDMLDFSLVADPNHTKDFAFSLKIEGEDNKYYNYAKELLADMADVLIIDAQVNLDQPTYDEAANDLSISGSAYANVTLDLTKDGLYTQALAVILAYGNPQYIDEVLAAKSCVVELNKIISKMTVQEVFTALKAMSYKVSMADMANAIGYTYSVEEMDELERIYFVILSGVGKALELLDVSGNTNPLSAYENGTATYTYSRGGAADVHVDFRSYDGVFAITSAELSFSIKLAPKCTGLIGDVNWDDQVDARDAAWMLKYDAEFDVAADMHLCLGDVNADGKIDARDAAWVLKYDAELCEYNEFPAVAR